MPALTWPWGARERGKTNMRHLSEGGQESGLISDRGRVRSTDAIQSAITRNPAFSVLDAPSLEGVLSVAELVRFPRRKPLYLEGEPAHRLFVLASGRARVVRGGQDARVLTVAYRVPGDLLGETALADGHTYRASATAIEPVEAVALPLRAALALLQENPGFSHRMLELMVDRRLQAERRVESLLSRTVESRVAEFLVDAAERYGVPDSRGVLISVKYTHQEIADYVGSTRETVTLTLGDFKRRSLLVFDHRRIVLNDVEGLARLR